MHGERARKLASFSLPISTLVRIKRGWLVRSSSALLAKYDRARFRGCVNVGARFQRARRHSTLITYRCRCSRFAQGHTKFIMYVSAWACFMQSKKLGYYGRSWKSAERLPDVINLAATPCERTRANCRTLCLGWPLDHILFCPRDLAISASQQWYQGRQATAPGRNRRRGPYQ